jgi:excisionase family DNA binding protein
MYTCGRFPARLRVAHVGSAMFTMPFFAIDGSKDLLSARQVAHRLSISVRTVWRMLERNELPQPVRFNRKLVRWRAMDIDKYVAALR